MQTIIFPSEIWRAAIAKKETLDTVPFSEFIFKNFKIETTIPTQEGTYFCEYYITWDFIDGEKVFLYEVFNNKTWVSRYQWIYDKNDIFKGTLIQNPATEEHVYKEKEIMKDSLWVILYCMGYIMRESFNRKRRFMERLSRHKYSREYRCSTSKNRIYLLDDVIQYAKDNYKPENHFSFKCPCWEVRGHYRHYKSGKVVFVPSYEKGKERGKVQPKENEYYMGV